MRKTQPLSAEMNPTTTLKTYEQLSSCVVTSSQVLLY